MPSGVYKRRQSVFAATRPEVTQKPEPQVAEAPVAEVERPDKLNRSGRPKRVPINGYRDVLKVDGQEPGWHYCWVNEHNVERFIAGLYEFVAHDVVVGHNKVQPSQMGGKVSKAVGNGVTAYLMRCLDEDYQEEMEMLHGIVDENELAMKQALNSKADGRYGEVQIGSNKPLAVPKSPQNYFGRK